MDTGGGKSSLRKIFSGMKNVQKMVACVIEVNHRLLKTLTSIHVHYLNLVKML